MGQEKQPLTLSQIDALIGAKLNKDYIITTIQNHKVNATKEEVEVKNYSEADIKGAILNNLVANSPWDNMKTINGKLEFLRQQNEELKNKVAQLESKVSDLAKAKIWSGLCKPSIWGACEYKNIPFEEEFVTDATMITAEKKTLADEAPGADYLSFKINRPGKYRISLNLHIGTLAQREYVFIRFRVKKSGSNTCQIIHETFCLNMQATETSLTDVCWRFDQDDRFDVQAGGRDHNIKFYFGSQGDKDNEYLPPSDNKYKHGKCSMKDRIQITYLGE